MFKRTFRTRHHRGRRAQLGSMMVEVSLALLIAALAGVGTMREILRVQTMQAADTEADTLALYRQALQDYVDAHYTALQYGTVITHNGVTLQPGTGLGQTLQPTVANLRSLGYLNAGFQDVTLVVDGGVFRNVIERQPAGCTGNACNVVGLAYIDRPIVVRGSADSNSVVLGQMLNRLGGLGGLSVEGSAATITGNGAGWTWPNPVSGAPAGVMGARFGFGSSMLAGYVRMNDTRDPNLQGPMTVAGAVTVNNSLQVNGPGIFTGAVSAASLAASSVLSSGQIKSQTDVGASDTAACLRAALEAGGNVISRAANCVVRAQVTNSGVAVNDAAGNTRINLDGATGLLSVRTSAGSQNIGLDGATGRVAAQRLRATSSASRGAACTDADDLVADTDGAGTILVCKGGVWRSPGLIQASAGEACTNAGSLARNSSDQALICRSDGASSTWRLLNDRVTTAVAVDVWSGNGAANVPVPSCGTDGTADVSVAAIQGGSDYGSLPPRNRFEIRVSGTGPWVVTPTMIDQAGNYYTEDSSGVPYALGWTATTFCRYPG